MFSGDVSWRGWSHIQYSMCEELCASFDYSQYLSSMSSLTGVYGCPVADVGLLQHGCPVRLASGVVCTWVCLPSFDFLDARCLDE